MPTDPCWLQVCPAGQVDAETPAGSQGGHCHQYVPHKPRNQPPPSGQSALRVELISKKCPQLLLSILVCGGSKTGPSFLRPGLFKCEHLGSSPSLWTGKAGKPCPSSYCCPFQEEGCHFQGGGLALTLWWSIWPGACERTRV